MNDNLKPELLWIEGRCYRVNDPTAEIAALREHDLYEDDAQYDVLDEADDDSAYEIVMVDNNRYVSHILIPKLYFGKIIGKKGANVSRIARETKTDIKIPRHGEKNISIFGPSASNVKAAIRRINDIVAGARMKQSPTHFISIPMNGPQIVESFERFKEQVLRECSNIEESLFIKSSKLHLTLGVMCLMDDEERLSASRLLMEAKDKCIMPLIKDHPPLKIRLRGLSYMNDDPRAVRVLFGRVGEAEGSRGVLQRVADDVFKHFDNSGLLKKENDRESVKLHVTLLNSKYRYRATHAQTDGAAGKYTAFDASEVMSKFGDYDFGVMELTDVRLSQCNTAGPDGYYDSTCLITCYNEEESEKR